VARSGDWDSLALRLDEILSAAGGEDPFSEALKLLVGKLLHEQEQQPANRGAKPGFLPADAGSRVAALNALLSRARQPWPPRASCGRMCASALAGHPGDGGRDGALRVWALALRRALG
jgi:hypothetical protein